MKKILFTLALLTPFMGKVSAVDCSECKYRMCCLEPNCACTNAEHDKLAHEMVRDELLKRQAAGENISQHALDYYSKNK